MIGLHPQMGLLGAGKWELLYAGLTGTNYPADVREGDVALFSQTGYATGGYTPLTVPTGGVTVFLDQHSATINEGTAKNPNNVTYYWNARASYKLLSDADASAAIGTGFSTYAIMRNTGGAPAEVAFQSPAANGTAKSYSASVNYSTQTDLPFHPLFASCRLRDGAYSTVTIGGVTATNIANRSSSGESYCQWSTLLTPQEPVDQTVTASYVNAVYASYYPMSLGVL